MEAMKLFDLILLGVGGYIIYGSCWMKKTGIICNWIMDEKNRKDGKEDTTAFIQKIFLPTLILGVLCLAYGVISAVNDFYKPVILGNKTLMVCFVVYAVWYCVRLQTWKDESLKQTKMPISANTKNKK